jgi:hypothetical protein
MLHLEFGNTRAKKPKVAMQYCPSGPVLAQVSKGN